MPVIARRCILLRVGASLSEDLRSDRSAEHPAPCVSGLSRYLRDYESASAWITLSFMDQNLCRRLVPRPKFGRSRPTAAAASPATSRSVHLQVVGREQMAVAADFRYRHGLEDTFQGKAHHLGFGCSKARPRYQFQRFAPSRSELPQPPAPARGPCNRRKALELLPTAAYRPGPAAVQINESSDCTRATPQRH